QVSWRAPARNVPRSGFGRGPGRSFLPSGWGPAPRAISRARSWYGSDRSMPCTWLLPPADATLRARRFRNEPVGHGALLVVVAPFCQLFWLSRPEHGCIFPLSEVNSSYIARGAPFASLPLR